MPIKGLTDRGLAFPCIGKIRKGAPKTDNAPGKDLDYFRIEFDQTEEHSAEIFNKVYGDQPRSINFIFPPHNSIDDIASFWLEAYTAGRMVARSDGEIYTYLVDTETGEILVRDGIEIATGKPKAYVPEEPAGYYVSGITKKQNPVYCKPVGRIKVVIPELRRAAWLLAMTSSIHDCINLSSQIRAYLTDYGNIVNIPFILKRVPRQISTPTKDLAKRARREKWLLSIEVNPAWFSKLLDSRKEQIYELEQPGQIQAEIMPGLKTGNWDTLPVDDDEPWDQEPIAENMGIIQEGEIVEPGDKKKGDYADLEFLAEKDPITAFWHLTTRIGLSKDDGRNIASECKEDFALAFQKLLKQAP